MDKNNNRGFAGLANLASDLQSPPPVRQNSSELLPPVSQQPVFPLLELTKYPTLPAPWSSADSGETWVWGNFFLTFQKNPKTVFDVTMEMQGKNDRYHGITYRYAISVFYHRNKNPHGPSGRPIMVISLEQANIGAMAGILGVQTDSNGMGPLMVGLFTGEARSNLGKYDGETSPQAIRQHLFGILGKQLGISGQPKIIGNLEQAYGHPETGLPAKKQNKGCALPALCLGLICLGAAGWIFL
ncbi:MAG: hypothetical protein NC211_07445 [Alistipes senegalensis]|nr:hypothetical protein [Oxalobacter formigenes]MCM1281644.1 hypothetical protein [Alistipes senegalensis]